MPYRAIKDRLMEMIREPKFDDFQLPCYHSKRKEKIRSELRRIVDQIILDVYVKVDQGLLFDDFVVILQKGLKKCNDYNLSNDETLFVRQYLIRIAVIVEWDKSQETLQNII